MNYQDSNSIPPIVSFLKQRDTPEQEFVDAHPEGVMAVIEKHYTGMSICRFTKSFDSADEVKQLIARISCSWKQNTGIQLVDGTEITTDNVELAVWQTVLLVDSEISWLFTRMLAKVVSNVHSIIVGGETEYICCRKIKTLT